MKKISKASLIISAVLALLVAGLIYRQKETRISAGTITFDTQK